MIKNDCSWLEGKKWGAARFLLLYVTNFVDEIGSRKKGQAKGRYYYHYYHYY